MDTRRASVVLICLSLALSACAQPRGELEPLGRAGSGFGSCEEIANISAPDDAYRDQPIYVSNEMPIDEVQAWAVQQPGFEGLWIDREHNGWVSVAFSADVEQRQAEIDERFPDDGVVAVAVTHTRADLEDLQNRVSDALAGITESFGIGVYENKGVVGVNLASLDPAVVSELEQRFPGEPICVDGPDPSTLPEPGPQQVSGDGWRLLADEAPAGESYRTGIATDRGGLETMWRTIGLEAEIPDVDFETEVVIWFGAVYGSSCPDLRLDEVVVSDDLVYAEIVMTTPAVACTEDANPHAYVVAVERSILPVGPFTIQLGPDVITDEATRVEADLSVPGTTLTPDQVHPVVPSDDRYVVSGDYIEEGFPTAYQFNTHCGIEWLGELNGVLWRTDQPLPDAWIEVAKIEMVVVEVVLATGNPPTVTATANGVSLTYLPDPGPQPGCD